MEVIFPEKLASGGHIRVIAPAQSLAIIAEDVRRIANRRFEGLGVTISFGKRSEEMTDLNSASIEARIADLHEAFADPTVTAIFTAIGGFNSNHLLKHIDWELIKNNPKLFCGYSDITVLNNAILAKTGLVTYSGLHYSSFGQKLYFDYSFEYFKRCVMGDEPFQIWASESWSDDKWYRDQNDRNLIRNRGWLTLREGEATGRIIGGNLGSFNLLAGTEFFPTIDEDIILFIEDDEETLPQHFDRYLQAVISQPWFKQVKGMAIGRFQQVSQITADKLTRIIETKEELTNMPVIANVDYGHTDPKITIPIGGRALISAHGQARKIEILEH